MNEKSILKTENILLFRISNLFFFRVTRICYKSDKNKNNQS